MATRWWPIWAINPCRNSTTTFRTAVLHSVFIEPPGETLSGTDYKFQLPLAFQCCRVGTDRAVDRCYREGVCLKRTFLRHHRNGEINILSGAPVHHTLRRVRLRDAEGVGGKDLYECFLRCGVLSLELREDGTTASHSPVKRPDQERRPRVINVPEKIYYRRREEQEDQLTLGRTSWGANTFPLERRWWLNVNASEKGR